MLKTKVVVTQPIHEEGMKILRNSIENVVVAPDDSIETIGNLLDESVEGVIVRYNPFSKELIDKAPNLKAIGRHGIGVELIDVKYASEKGIIVVNTPNAATVSVVEHTITMMLALAKKLTVADQELRNGNYAVKNSLGSIDLECKYLGVIGAGKIGLDVAKRCKCGFNMNVIVYDPYLDKKVANELGIEVVNDLEEVLTKGDFITLHTPLTLETKHMISMNEFKKMKNSAFLINCGRGELVNESDLITALESKEISGAGLDVFEKEPPKSDNPLFKMKQVVVTPHSASLTVESKIKMAMGAAEQVVQILKGEKAKFVVNPK